jgi:uncharacterized protein (TIGR00255 family)
MIETAYTQMQRIMKRMKIKQELDLGDFISIPHSIKVDPPDFDEKVLWNELSTLVKKALEKCRHFRIREGKILKRQINSSIRALRQSQQEIVHLKDIVVENYRKRLRRRVRDLSKSEDITINNERLEAEVLFYADKADITEELIRIKSHLGGFKKYLAENYEGQVGKALDFLSQELLREVNTIASKARDTEVAQCVLLMKNEVEKIREQVQNIE